MADKKDGKSEIVYTFTLTSVDGENTVELQ